MKYSVLIIDCDVNGIPMGTKCPHCGIFVGNNKLNNHVKSCGKKYVVGYKRK